jgi:hypothetical protein
MRKIITLVLIIITLVGCNQAQKKSDKITLSQKASTTVEATTAAATPTPTATSTPEPTLTEREKYIQEIKEKMKKSKGKFVNAKDSKDFEVKTLVNIDDKLCIGFESFRSCFDDGALAFSYDFYDVIVNISIVSISDEDLAINSNSFTLYDSQSYSYSPDLTYRYLRGDIEGLMKFKDFKRGDIAFKVPINQTKFTLKFSYDKLTPVYFNVDLTKNIVKHGSPPQN